MLPVPEITTAASYVPQTSAELLRVVVASSDPEAGARLRSIIGAFDDMIVVDEAGGADAFRSRSRSSAPDLVVVDGAIAPSMTKLPTLLLIGGEDPATTSAALSAGARGVILRSATPERLHAALRAIAEGLVVVDGELPADGRQLPPVAPLAEPLTARELEVLQLLASGRTNKEIATTLRITDHTVKFHVNAILGKLAAETRTEAVVHAVRRGIVVL